MRALPAFSADGEPYLALLDQHETRKVWLGLSKDSGLAIRDIDGETRLVLSLDRKSEPTLVLSDRLCPFIGRPGGGSLRQQSPLK